MFNGGGKGGVLGVGCIVILIWHFDSKYNLTGTRGAWGKK
jgi:hypothetical protein